MAKKLLPLLILLIALCALAQAEGLDPDGQANTGRLPAGLASIGEEAFEGTAFRAIVFPEGDVVVGSGAFAAMPELSTVGIPGRARLAEDAFRDSPGVTLFGRAGGDTQDYARRHGIPFIDVRALPSALHRLGAALGFALLTSFACIAAQGLSRRLKAGWARPRSLRRRDRPEMDIPEAVIP